MSDSEVRDIDAPGAPHSPSDPAPAGVAAEVAPPPPAPPAPRSEPLSSGQAEDPELDGVEPAAIDQPADEEADAPFDKLAARARRFSPERVRTVLEALLLVTDRPLGLEAMRATTGVEVEVLRAQLQKLQGHYRDGVRGIVLHEVAGGWQLRTDASTSEFVRRFLKVRPQRLTRAALETLAIIAYRQPVTRPEIEDVRAVDSGAVVKALLERRLIKIIGKKEEPGRPLLYGTTPEFLEFFNLRDLTSLPTLREFQELSEESQAIVEKETGEATPPAPEGPVTRLQDPGFESVLAQSNAEADAALAELETALSDAEQKTAQASRLLEPSPEGGAPAPDDADDDDAPEVAPEAGGGGTGPGPSGPGDT